MNFHPVDQFANENSGFVVFESWYCFLKLHEARLKGLVKLAPLAYAEEFRRAFHPDREGSLKQAIACVYSLHAQLLPEIQAEADKAKKGLQQSKADDSVFDFDIGPD